MISYPSYTKHALERFTFNTLTHMVFPYLFRLQSSSVNSSLNSHSKNRKVTRGYRVSRGEWGVNSLPPLFQPEGAFPFHFSELSLRLRFAITAVSNGWKKLPACRLQKYMVRFSSTRATQEAEISLVKLDTCSQPLHLQLL